MKLRDCFWVAVVAMMFAACSGGDGTSASPDETESSSSSDAVLSSSQGQKSSSSTRSSSSSREESAKSSSSENSSSSVNHQSDSDKNSSSSAKEQKSSSSQNPGFEIKETCTETRACDAMDRKDVSTWNFTIKDSFGKDVKYIYSVEGETLVLTTIEADGTKKEDRTSYSFYNMTKESSQEMAFMAARSTCRNGGGDDVIIKDCVQDTIFYSSSSEEVIEESSSSSMPIVYGKLVDDRDGQVYRTLEFGDQTWMAENLNFAYNYPTAKEDSSSFCYDNDPSNCEKYGRLYLWSAAMDSSAIFSKTCMECGYYATYEGDTAVTFRGVCPKGWHLPRTTEWQQLYVAIEDSVAFGSKMKTTTGWTNTNGTDEYGFSILPVGYRRDIDGKYTLLSEGAFYWTSSEYDMRSAFAIFFGNNTDEYRQYHDYKYTSASVRCVKDK